MSPTNASSATQAARAPLIGQTLTRPGESPFDLVDWSVRSVQIRQHDGRVAFACDDVEAPITWSNLAAWSSPGGTSPAVPARCRSAPCAG